MRAVARVTHDHGYMRSEPSIVVSSLHHLDAALKLHNPKFVVSILSDAERLKLPAPTFGDRAVLELRFDDVAYSAERFAVPGEQHIRSLIEFASRWAGSSGLLVHCRAGTSRSVAGAAIAVAAIGRIDLVQPVVSAKTYFRPNQKMLEIADMVLGTNLLGLVRALPQPDREDEWGPAFVPVAP